MPPKARQNSRNSIEKEGRIILAISTLNKQEISSIHEAARIFNISHATLCHQINRTTSRLETRANSYKLTQNEEESLV
jgi:hypothetical protein